MQNCQHPLMSKHNQMGFLSDLKSWSQSLIDDFNKDYVDPALEAVGLTPEQQDKIKKDAEAAIQKEIQQQQQSLITQVTGGGGMQSKQPPSGFTSIVSDIQDHAVVKAVPGGIYTIGALGGLLLFTLLRGR